MNKFFLLFFLFFFFFIQYKEQKNFDYEIIPKKNFNECTFSSLEEDLLKILGKIE